MHVSQGFTLVSTQAEDLGSYEIYLSVHVVAVSQIESDFERVVVSFS